MEKIIKDVNNKKILINQRNEENRMLVKQLQELKTKYEESSNNNDQMSNIVENDEENENKAD